MMFSLSVFNQSYTANMVIAELDFIKKEYRLAVIIRLKKIKTLFYLTTVIILIVSLS